MAGWNFLGRADALSAAKVSQMESPRKTQEAPDGCPRHVPSSAGTPSAGRLRPSGGPASVTVIPALADMEPLLQDNERRAKERIGEAASHPAEVERGVEEDERRRGRPGDREAQASEARTYAVQAASDRPSRCLFFLWCDKWNCY
ncbi:unnamed protein product [Effrenium voratum]|nr:unnamed protein product [Effrenium voratum]